MNSIFDKKNYDQIVSRIQNMRENIKPLWGKMNASQMMHHLNRALKAPLGKWEVSGKPIFFMKMFKGVLYNDKPFGKGVPTPKDFKVTDDTYSFDKEKQEVLISLEEIFHQGVDGVYKPHVFFGNLTNQQWGKHIFKHTDHHLKQFGF